MPADHDDARRESESAKLTRLMEDYLAQVRDGREVPTREDSRMLLAALERLDALLEEAIGGAAACPMD